MTIGERVKTLRKELHLTQVKFGERIGIKGNTIANYEINKSALSAQTIKSICREYSVSREWLVEGKGDMFVQLEDSDVLTTIERILKNENETAKAVFKAFAKLDDADWETVAKFIKYLKENDI